MSIFRSLSKLASVLALGWLALYGTFSFISDFTKAKSSLFVANISTPDGKLYGSLEVLGLLSGLVITNMVLQYVGYKRWNRVKPKWLKEEETSP